MAATEHLLDLTVPLPPQVVDPSVTAAWAAHLAAGRIGVAAPRADRGDGADHGCAGLARAMGWAGATGRFPPAGEG